MNRNLAKFIITYSEILTQVGSNKSRSKKNKNLVNNKLLKIFDKYLIESKKGNTELITEMIYNYVYLMKDIKADVRNIITTDSVEGAIIASPNKKILFLIIDDNTDLVTYWFDKKNWKVEKDKKQMEFTIRLSVLLGYGIDYLRDTILKDVPNFDPLMVRTYLEKFKEKYYKCKIIQLTFEEQITRLRENALKFIVGINTQFARDKNAIRAELKILSDIIVSETKENRKIQAVFTESKSIDGVIGTIKDEKSGEIIKRIIEKLKVCMTTGKIKEKRFKDMIMELKSQPLINRMTGALVDFIGSNVLGEDITKSKEYQQLMK